MCLRWREGMVLLLGVLEELFHSDESEYNPEPPREFCMIQASLKH